MREPCPLPSSSRKRRAVASAVLPLESIGWIQSFLVVVGLCPFSSGVCPFPSESLALCLPPERGVGYASHSASFEEGKEHCPLHSSSRDRRSELCTLPSSSRRGAGSRPALSLLLVKSFALVPYLLPKGNRRMCCSLPSSSRKDERAVHSACRI